VAHTIEAPPGVSADTVVCIPYHCTQVAKRLFDIDIVPADGEVPVWHSDVRFFKVLAGGAPRAYFYLDPYSRPAEKRGGAWMAEVRLAGHVCLNFHRFTRPSL
jgi:Zn-dependent oligopeptidase